MMSSAEPLFDDVTFEPYQGKPPKIGRPTLYKPEYADHAFHLTSLGATLNNLAGVFQVDLNTLELWKNQYPEFMGAINAGRKTYDSNVETALYRRALGFVKNGKVYAPDVEACKFWLKNRQRERWKDRVDVDHSGEVKFTAIERQVIDIPGEVVEDGAVSLPSANRGEPPLAVPVGQAKVGQETE